MDVHYSFPPDEDCFFHRLRLCGDWQVCPTSLDAEDITHLSFQNARCVPDCAHLQPILYPDQPYWGEHLRRINEQAWVYRRTFTIPNAAYERARLRFEGVDHFARVWLNGHYLGQHEGHFAPFEFNVTDYLTENNILLVCVTSPWDKPNMNGSYPSDHVIRGLVKGLYEHGEGVIPPNVNPIGIWRPVWLFLDQGLSLDRVRIYTELDGQIRLNLTTSENIHNETLNLSIEAVNHDGPGVETVLDLSTLEHTMRVPEPRFWWPWDHGEPNLYRLTASLQDRQGRVLSRLTETFGIRQVELERTPERFTYRINGRDIFIRGSAYIPSLYLSDCRYLERDLSLAKEANLNLLRVHTHVSPPELYDRCDRMGILIWQDFELNWIHEPSLQFEARALKIQREMIDLLGNHPSIMSWACHNEPTMLFARRENLEAHPDPALYADATQQDPTRPVFICSGQMERDWQRAGDAHTYYGAIWTKHYTDVYRHRPRLNTEFGFEAPASLDTLKSFPFCWERLRHLENQIDDLWDYQADLIQFHVEHFRRLRAECCGGYIHFWLVDLVPQVGCGILDSQRLPKGGYEALCRASQPLQIALEHDGKRPRALWVFNDTPDAYPNVTVCWNVQNVEGQTILKGETAFDIQANASQKVMGISWRLPIKNYACVQLKLLKRDQTILASNTYHHPFQPLTRPRGYPWKFDPTLGVKVFDRPGAPSLADQTTNPLVRRIPLGLRKKIAEWGLQQQLPPRFLSMVSRIAGRFMGNQA